MEQQENPYQIPNSEISARPTPSDLADRMTRLGASFVDGMIMLVLLMPTMYLSGYFRMVTEVARGGGAVPFGTTVLWSVLGFGAFILLQGFPLNASGQTWGKRLLQIKIVDLEGKKPSLGEFLLKRYLPIQVAGLVPFACNLYMAVDTLMIFREDRRCLHDLLAGTRVVIAK